MIFYNYIILYSICKVKKHNFETKRPTVGERKEINLWIAYFAK